MSLHHFRTVYVSFDRPTVNQVEEILGKEHILFRELHPGPANVLFNPLIGTFGALPGLPPAWCGPEELVEVQVEHSELAHARNLISALLAA